MLTIGNKLYGFVVKRETDTDEGAKLYELEYEKNGAKLLYFARPDKNKTFSIAFKTIPENSTGVFHIIEHSVLCGSDKYPVKEPFVDLLKGSLNTFLNAMTFPDKTMYPVSSRNDKDFLNLMGVYLDAVLHPAIIKNPNIFRQEGWHYEVSDDGTLSTSGVVLNEMRGAYSDADDVELEELKKLFYPDTCYRHDSGGNPDVITALTYEEFVRMHAKYYHPSNSYIFLDGEVNLDETLALIDSYLSEYEKLVIDFDIEDQKPVCPPEHTAVYEIGDSESEENKTRLSLAFYGWRFDDRERALSINILLDALMSSNEAPLKKVLLASGLCDEVNISSCDSIKDNMFALSFKNVKDGKTEELKELFYKTVEELCEKGIDKELLESSLNNYEFKVREKDYGTMPRGVIYAMTVLETALYGGAPEASINLNGDFKKLHEKLGTSYFDSLLKELFLENNHKASLVMLPSKTLGKERSEKELAKMEKAKLSLGESGVAKAKEIHGELLAWQKSEDSAEAKATIPALSRDDIEELPEKMPRVIKNVNNTVHLAHDIPSGGIVYAKAYFDVSDLSADDIFDVKILTALFANLPTKKRDAISLQNLIKRELGTLDLSFGCVARDGGVMLQVVANASALSSNYKKIPEIMSEAIFESDFSAKEIIRSLVKQLKIASEMSFANAGHMSAFTRAAAYTITSYAVNDYYSGYEAHKKLTALDKNFDAEFDGLKSRLEALVAKIFTLGRMAVSTVGEGDALAKELTEIFPKSEKIAPVCEIKPLGIKNEGIVIPAQVGYASSAGSLESLGIKNSGSYMVARGIVSFEYLWGAVRVQGGAYGAGLIARKTGDIAYYSYRDPQPARTLGVYGKTAEFLREFANGDTDITKYIIGAVGDLDMLLTPRLVGTVSANQYFSGTTYEDECKYRKELLNTSKDDLLRVADALEKIEELGARCVVAGREKLDSAKDYLNTIIEL